MHNTEKFMFDTNFDELEPILPEALDTEDINGPADIENEEEQEAEPDNPASRVFDETDILAAREEGFQEGKKLGASEILSANEKDLNDTLTAITNNISVIQLEQKQVNQGISKNAVTLTLAIVRKFLPELIEQTSLDEINSVVRSVITRLTGGLEVIVKVNPSIMNDLSDKLNSQFDEDSGNKKLSVIAEETIKMGDCKIEWPNGSAERNLNKLMEEIDDIILQNTAPNSQSRKDDEFSEDPNPNNQEITEK